MTSTCSSLDKFHNISLTLQSDNPEKVNLALQRALFDKLLADFGDKYPTIVDYIGPDASIIHNTTFEKAVIKVNNM